MLDSALSFNCHVNNVTKMVAYKINLLSKIRRYLNDNVVLKIYKSMILRYFDYGDVVYGAANAAGLDKLQRLQNRGLIICKDFDRRFNTARLHTIKTCPMLKDRWEAHLNNFMYGKLNCPDVRDNRKLNTRAHDAPLFTVKNPQIETYKRAVEYGGAVQWNNLPVKTRSINNLIHLKNCQSNALNR